MKKCVSIAMLAGLVLSAPAIAGGPCCEKAKAENAWCSGCNHGFMFNVSIAKKALYETLAAIAASNECEGCKKAAETNGVCEKCHMGIVKDKAYKAMPAYYIARGEKAQADKRAAKTNARQQRSDSRKTTNPEDRTPDQEQEPENGGGRAG